VQRAYAYLLKYSSYSPQYVLHCVDRPMGIDSKFHMVKNILASFGLWRELARCVHDS
jgi:hypothetical protein